MAGEHQCVRARRCAGAQQSQDGRWLGAPTRVAGSLCTGCLPRVRGALDALPRDYIELEAILDQHPVAGRPKVSGTPEPPAPPRLDVMVTQARIDTTLTQWAPPIAERIGVTWDHRAMTAHRPGPRVHRAARLLALNVELFVTLGPHAVAGWIAGTPATVTRTGVDAAVTLLTLHQQARLLVAGDSGDVRLPVPCPRCEGLLVRPNGAGHVACRDCGAAWPESDYRRLCLVLAEDYRVPA